MRLDVLVTNHGTLFTFEPRTDDARAWIAEHVGGETTWISGALVVEHRYAHDLAEGMRGAGLVLR